MIFFVLIVSVHKACNFTYRYTFCLQNYHRTEECLTYRNFDQFNFIQFPLKNVVLLIILYVAYNLMKNKILEKHAWGYIAGRSLSWDSVPDSWHSLLLTFLPTTPHYAFQLNARNSDILIDCEEARERKENKLAFTEHLVCIWLLCLALSLSPLLLKETLKGQRHFPQLTNEETDIEKLKVTTLKERQLYGAKAHVLSPIQI